MGNTCIRAEKPGPKPAILPTHAKQFKKKDVIPADYDYLFKIVIIGDSGVGKSSLLLRYCDNTFMETFISTIGVDFKLKNQNIRGQRIKQQLWDTSGQERFRTITSSYYRGSHGAMVVFDVTSRDSFMNVSRWLKEVNRYMNDDIPILLVGNKCDWHERREVVHSEAEELARELNITYIEASAKSAQNVDGCFDTLSDLILRKHQDLE